MPLPRTILLPLLLLLVSAARAAAKPALCNSYNPRCGLSASEAVRAQLSSYASLVSQLRRLSRTSATPLTVAPLIRNATNAGLLDIDVPLDPALAPAVNVSVCGTDALPTIREAVVCTVTHAGDGFSTRGNVQPAHIGLSTQGRQLWAARLGNPAGTRVLFVTQLHGNEASSTDAALRLLRRFARNRELGKRILSDLDVIFVMRANPDGGEPTANANPLLGVPFTETEGFFRHNVDPAAGGGLVAPTEPGFRGVVGRGYDLNRYTYGGLRNPIRPVESQAMVAAVHAFRPQFVYDLHGDGPKTFCELNPVSVRPSGLGPPLAECLPPAPRVPTLAKSRHRMVIGGFFADDPSVLSSPGASGLQAGPTFRRNARLVRTIAAEVIGKIDPRVAGRFSRFNQQQGGIATFTDGTMDRAGMVIGAVGSGWETLNFGTALRTSVVGLQFNGTTPVPEIGFDTSDVDACFLKDNICLQQLLLRHTLVAVAKFSKRRVPGDNGFCNIPLDDASVVSLPATGGFGNNSIEDPVLVPQAGGLDGALGIPFAISGKCQGDVSGVRSTCNS